MLGRIRDRLCHSTSNSHFKALVSSASKVGWQAVNDFAKIIFFTNSINPIYDIFILDT